jgi:hypothetical protein
VRADDEKRTGSGPASGAEGPPTEGGLRALGAQNRAKSLAALGAAFSHAEIRELAAASVISVAASPTPHAITMDAFLAGLTPKDSAQRLPLLRLTETRNASRAACSYCWLHARRLPSRAAWVGIPTALVGAGK